MIDKMSRDPDPLDVSEGVPMVPGLTLRKLLANAAGLPLRRLEELPVDVTHGIHRAWNRGYAVGESMGRHEGDRRRRAGVLLAILLVTTAFAVELAWAPRSAQVNPSGPGTTATTAPELSGAPESDGVTTPAPSASVDPSSFPPIGYGVAHPKTGHDAGWSCSSPCKPTPSPRPAVSHGTSGQATWWNSFGGGYYAAIRPDLGTKGDLAIVCGGSPFHCRSVEVITTCACLGPNSDRLIDLSLDTFVDFAPPGVWPGTTKPRDPGWQGTIRVVVQVIKR